MKRLGKIHWRWFKSLHEAWKLNPANGDVYSGMENDCPDIIQIAEAENGHLKIWKYLREEKYFWIVNVGESKRFGLSDDKQTASMKAAIEYKRLCLRQ